MIHYSINYIFNRFHKQFFYSSFVFFFFFQAEDGIRDLVRSRGLGDVYKRQEYEGTFPLPEAQLDRFLMRIKLGYPQLSDEIRILELQQMHHPIEDIGIVADVEELLAVQEEVKSIFVSPAVKRYIVELVRATRDHQDVYLGSSPRGSLGLFRSGQVKAAMQGRDYVLPDDIKYLAPIILSHRIMVQPASRLRNLSAEQVVTEVLGYLPVPSKELAVKK